MAQEQLESLPEQVQHKIAVLTRLAEASAELNSTQQLETILTNFMDIAAEITDCTDASVLLWNNKSHELFFAATTSRGSQALMGKPVPLDSIAGEIIRTNDYIQVDDENDPRIYRKVDEDIQFVTKSLLGVPMTFKNRVIGVVEVLNKRQLPWTDDDRRYLKVLAAQAAIAIETAQMVIALKQANEEMRQLDKLKNDFIAIASHELRTPLGVILGYATFLQEETTDEAREHAGRVLASAMQLRRIIEDMVNLRYLKQKETELLRENVVVGDLIEQMYSEFLTLTEVHNHHLVINLPPKHAIVRADRNRLTMILTNLLNNAVSFTPEGGYITIEGKVEDGEVHVSVIDNGIGMTPEQQKRVFDEFYQAEDHMTRHVGGLGIGLSITRALVQAHGGRIWCESEGANKGSTFTFALPIADNGG